MQIREEGNDTPKRMRAYRQKLRESGLRPVQIWVPDMRLPRMKEEAARQSRLAATATDEDASLSFIEAAADYGSLA
jgi:hypothetical protein